MGNIISYLKWRGDLSFAESNFCEVDNLILSELSYLNFSGIVSDDQKLQITIKDAVDSQLLEPQNEVFAKKTEMLKIMAKTKRFRNLLLSKYTEVFDRSSHTDFSAVCIELDQDTCYVAYRGTTNSIMGWREDFSMSYQLMPSQPLADEYLQQVLRETKYSNIYVGGHSKGGNLAVYAAMMCSPDQLQRIKRVFSNDGPGLCPDLIDMEKYRSIRPKLLRIVPEFSVVGALFEYESPDMIVASEDNGIMQHVGLSWCVEGDQFQTVKKRAPESDFYNQIFDDWIESASMDQRESFTRDFFDALEASGAKNISDLSGNGILLAEDILLSMVTSENKTKIAIGKLVDSLFHAFSNIRIDELFKQKQMLQGVLLFIAGLVFVAAPEVAAGFVGVAACFAALVWLVRRQLSLSFGKSHNLPFAREKMVIQMISMCAVTFLLSKQAILLRFSNLLMGVIFLVFAYKSAKKIFQKDIPKSERLIQCIFFFAALLLGIVPIVTANLVLWQYLMTAGSFLIINGVTVILDTMYQNGMMHQRTEHF